jgi:hypothetical protein
MRKGQKVRRGTKMYKEMCMRLERIRQSRWGKDYRKKKGLLQQLKEGVLKNVSFKKPVADCECASSEKEHCECVSSEKVLSLSLNGKKLVDIHLNNF